MQFSFPAPPDPQGLRTFGIATGIGFSFVFGLFFPWLLDITLPLWPFAVGGLLFITALVAPKGLKPVYRAWMGVAVVVGWLNSQVLLTLVFMVVLTPIGLIRRALGSDTLGRRFSRKSVSYRRPSEKREPDHVERPF